MQTVTFVARAQMIKSLFGLLFAFGISAPIHVAAANACLQDNDAAQPLTGKIAVELADGSTQGPDSALILKLPAPICLDAEDAADHVASTTNVHVFGADDGVHASLQGLVGKTVLVRGRPFPAHTTYHRAPVVMEVEAVDTP